MLSVNDIWYKKNLKALLVSTLLMPFTLLFYIISSIRSLLYKFKFLKSYKSKKYVIVVGGITVGGAGKTPLSIALLKRLKKEGYRACLLSRGYKANPPYSPYEVQDSDSSDLAGDEPLLIKKETKARVFIASKRVEGARLIDSIDDLDIIVMDDGLQHYALDRDFEIVVLDKERMCGNNLVMPSGPLRETRSRLKSVDAVVVNGGSDRDDYYSMFLKAEKIRNLKDEEVILDKNIEVCALSGIANPNRFYNTLTSLGFKVADTISIGDHEKVALDLLKSKSKTMPIIMTSKDYVKYKDLNLDNVYYLNVESILDERFFTKILDKIKIKD